MELVAQKVDSDNFDTYKLFEKIWMTGFPKVFLISLVVIFGVLSLIWFFL